MVNWIRVTLFAASILSMGSCADLLSETANGLPVLPTSVIEDVYSGSVIDDVYSPGSAEPLQHPDAGKPTDRAGGLPGIGF